MKEALVILSGGQDSTAALFWARIKGFDVLHALTFDYGQRHLTEIKSAGQVSYLAGVQSHEIVHMGPILKGTSPLTNPEVTLAQYPDGDLPGGLEKTFVPMRNQLFLTLAANRSYVLGGIPVIIGVSQEDYGGYPDCREGFLISFEETSALGTFTGEDGAPDGLSILTPWLNLTKAEEIQETYNMGRPQGTLCEAFTALAFSHTSYDGAYPPTGSDHATKLREKGFAEAGLPDPLIVRAALVDKVMELPDAPNYDRSLTLNLALEIRNTVRGLKEIGLL